MLPDICNAVEITEPGSPEVLKLSERPLPRPASGEVLIKVGAAGVNRPDVFQRKGLYPPPPGASDIPGLEVAGTVVARGPETSLWREGDRVCALLTGGGYSEYAVAHESCCLPVPDGFSDLQAAALPETFFTVWHNIFERAAFREGDTVLIHGGSSGIGTTAIQLVAARGGRVFTTAGSEEKCRFCEQLGAEKAFNYRTEDFTHINSLTDGEGADIILDMVGGDYVQKNIDCAARRGRILYIAFLKGSRAEVDFRKLMLKQLVITGSTLRAQPVADKARIAAGLRENIWPLLESGRVTPVIHSQFPLGEATQAHQLMESSRHIGKIMLTTE